MIKTVRFFGDFCCNYKENIILDEGLTDADYNIINLETPLVHSDLLPARKAGPHLKGERDKFIQINQQLKNKNIYMLANNHIADFGESGIKETVDFLDKQKNYYTGISNLDKILYISLNEKFKISIINICEEQYGMANINRLGSNPISENIYKLIIDAKNNSDFLIVSVHAGAEMCPYPYPKLQNLYHSFIDIGVDFIHGTHSHIPQGYEIYKEKYIFYGLGNFCIDYQKWKYNSELCLYSYSPLLIIDNQKIEIKVDILKCNDRNISIEYNLHSKIKDYFDKLNKPLYSEKILDKFWSFWSLKIYNDSIDEWLFHKNKLTIKKIIKNIIAFIKYKSIQTVDKDSLLLNYHLWSCLSHSEAIKRAVGILSGELLYNKEEIENNKDIILKL